LSNGIKLCRSCMSSVAAEATNCPNCGYNGKQQNDPKCLPIGFRLAGRYVVGMRKSEDGNSVSYVGFDCMLNKPVEVREFFPPEGCTRNPQTYELIPNQGAELHFKTSLMDFCELFKNLRKIEGNPGIIRTADFFEGCGTAYAILDIFDGITLREFLSMAGGSITLEQTITLLEPIFVAVEAIHAVNLIHRGISPETIFVNRNGDVRLGGFATSQVRTKGTEVAVKLFSGFAAPEQYATTMWQGTSTDVYALAAVAYRCITGIIPQDADQRRSYDTLEPISRIKPQLAPDTSRTVSLAMLINSQERTQYASDLLSQLKGMHEQQYAVAPSGYDTGRHDTGRYNTSVLRDDYARGSDAGDDGYDDDYDDRHDDYDRRTPRKKSDEKESGYPRWIQKLGVANFWVIVVVLVVIVVTATVLLIVTSPFGTQEEEEEPPEEEAIVVPNYVGLELSHAINGFDNENFLYEYEDVYESKDKKNYVVRQTPEPGTEVTGRTVITLYINKGLRVEMIDVLGMTQDKAERVLKDKGIDYEIIEKISDEYTDGTVMEQSIKPGEYVLDTQKVRLTIARAPLIVTPPEDAVFIIDDKNLIPRRRAVQVFAA